jgi:SAM-dependent methyltransferase
VKIPDFWQSHNEQISELIRSNSKEKAMKLAVGGEFEAVGQLEYFLLLQHGLEKEHNIIDVGCGSGRLAFQLREYLEGRYIGIDVVPELFTYAEKNAVVPIGNFMKLPDYQYRSRIIQLILSVFSQFLPIFYMKNHINI